MTDQIQSMRLQPGDVAPEFQVQLPDGRAVHLADYRGERLLLIFLRHLACLPCQEHLCEVQDRLSEIRNRGTHILVISFDGLDQVRKYRSLLNLSFPVAADTGRAAYRAYGLTRASFLQTWHAKTMWRYLVLIREGRRFRRPKKGDDLSQLGADFVVDAHGKIEYAHYGARPDDRPDIAEVIDAIVMHGR